MRLETPAEVRRDHPRFKAYERVLFRIREALINDLPRAYVVRDDGGVIVARPAGVAQLIKSVVRECVQLGYLPGPEDTRPYHPRSD